MEIIIALVVIAVVAYFVFFRKSAEPVAEAVPYKVEEPVVSATPAATAKKPRVAKAATAKKPAVKAKTATRKPKAK